jgi:hypothetical protein
MLTFPNQIGNRQEQLTHFSRQLTQLYQDAKSERLQVTASYPASAESFSILEELELLTVSICGYTTQIQSPQKISNPEKVVADLRGFNVFENPVVVQFYQAASHDYPKLQAYIQLLDYLRLLALEYLQSPAQQLSISA